MSATRARQAMGIQRYVFFSIHNADRHPDVPLMQIKARTEEFLAASGLNFTILRLCGFMQAIIGNYAVPILEEKQVWGTSDATRTAYLDSQVRRRGCLPWRRCVKPASSSCVRRVWTRYARPSFSRTICNHRWYAPTEHSRSGCCRQAVAGRNEQSRCF